MHASLGRHLDNMNDMMGRLALTRTMGQGIDERILGAAVQACETCPKCELCHDWLLRAAPTLKEAPPFCPNAARFRQLKVNPS